MILVTGAKGMLGTDLSCFLRSNNAPITEWDLPEQDITDVNQTIKGIKEIKPKAIIHLAAYTDVDGCEVAKSRAYAVNVQGTWAVLLGAKETKSKLVYLSTDYVFDGEKNRSYLETDRPNPINYYGLTKLKGEELIRTKLKNRYFIVRTSWLFGKFGKNFVTTIMKLAQEQDTLRVVNDQRGSPTYTKDLAPCLFNLINSERYGIYHITNSGIVSWFEFARAILKEAGLKNQVVPISSEESGRRALRPKFSGLENRNYVRIFGNPLRSWELALKDFLKDIK